ncbi:MAG TPA: fused MFS/spermidine synthase, partial [bacterium]|nr:fused MFS/spermidine synthase [bacterium]
WTRILVFVLTSATYSFSIMLAAFLFSIAIGGLAGGRWAERSRNPRRLLGLLEIGAGLAAVAALLLLLSLPRLQSLFFTPSPTTTWWQWNGVRFLQAFLVTSLAAFLLGATFPVAYKALAVARERLSTAVGELYFYNTLGGVAGSLLTGLVLIAWLGAAATMVLMILLNVALGVWLLRGGTFRRRTIVAAAAALILMAVIIRLIPATLLARIYSISEAGYPLVALREGIEGTVTVHRQDRGDAGERRIDVDGLNVAGSSKMLRTLQLLQGHLPLMVHPEAQRVLQIGFGTGQTSRAVLSHPVAAFQLVEISPDVLRLSGEFFRDLNQEVMQDPRFQPLILDGKNQIRYTRECYDVILNDANYAVATASASLFTRDHFENARRKLNPGGLFSTWMTTDLDPEDFRIVLRTFQSIFPHAVLWMAPNCINKQVVLMGSTEPLRFAWDKWQARWPHAAAGLESVDILSPNDLFACLLLDEKGMARLCKGAPVNSDDRPVLEFSTRDVRARDLCAFQNLSAMLAEPPDWRQYLDTAPGKAAVAPEEWARLERWYRASRQLFLGILQFYRGQTKQALTTMLNSSRLIPESRLASGFYAEVDSQTMQLFQAMNQNPVRSGPRLMLARHYIGLERYGEAATLLRPLVRLDPPDPAAAYENARILLAQGKIDSARLWIDRTLQQKRGMAGAWFLSARIAERKDDPERALQDYRSALDRDPGMHEAHARIGHLLLRQGRYPEARQELMRSLQGAPAQSGVAAELGDAFLFERMPEQAVQWYRKAIRLGETGGRTFHNLGNALTMLGRFEEAIQAYRIALEQEPDRAEILYNLANALIQLNQDQEAVRLLRRAIEIDPGQADYFNNLAMLHKKMGDRIGALQVLNTGLHRHPGSSLMVRNRQILIDELNRRR